MVFASGEGTNFEAILKSPIGYLIFGLISDRKCKAIDVALKYERPYWIVPNNKLASREIIKILKDESVDYVVLAGYKRIICGEIIDLFKNKIINIHPSLLPLYKGLNGIEKSFDMKDKYTGVTIHLINKEIDSGTILFQKSLKIKKDWKLNDLEREIHKIEHTYFWKEIEKEVKKWSF